MSPQPDALIRTPSHRSEAGLAAVGGGAGGRGGRLRTWTIAQCQQNLMGECKAELISVDVEPLCLAALSGGGWSTALCAAAVRAQLPSLPLLLLPVPRVCAPPALGKGISHLCCQNRSFQIHLPALGQFFQAAQCKRLLCPLSVCGGLLLWVVLIDFFLFPLESDMRVALVAVLEHPCLI